MSKTTEKKRLMPEQLRKKTDALSMGFKTTDDLKPLEEFIGQNRAVSAFSFGLEVESKGYNIFILGNPGSGRTTYALERLGAASEKQPAPDDWVYVYNFDEPGRPLAVNLPAGKGKIMGSAFEDLIEELKVAISKAFEKSQYEDAKAQLVKEFQEEVNGLMEEVKAWAAEKHLPKRTPQGFVNIPLTEERAKAGAVVRREIQQEEFEALAEEEQKEWQKSPRRYPRRPWILLGI